jgi:hypothetical protein
LSAFCFVVSRLCQVVDPGTSFALLAFLVRFEAGVQSAACNQAAD